MRIRGVAMSQTWAVLARGRVRLLAAMVLGLLGAAGALGVLYPTAFPAAWARPLVMLLMGTNASDNGAGSSRDASAAGDTLRFSRQADPVVVPASNGRTSTQPSTNHGGTAPTAVTLNAFGAAGAAPDSAWLALALAAGGLACLLASMAGGRARTR